MTDETATSVEVECVYDNGCGKPEGECAVTCKAALDAVAMAISKSKPVASTAPAAAAHPLVKGRCPACNGSSLFLGSGGHVTCSRLDCPNPCAVDDQLHRGRPDPAAAGLEETARVFAALHRSAEETVTRVINLHEQWVKAGPPPLGTSIARWWDKRLAEHHNAINPPSEQQEQP